MSNISYCDNCVHNEVCKYTKQVREYEEKAPMPTTVKGPVIGYNINCRCKRTEDDYK